jgi:hypothetical protein
VSVALLGVILFLNVRKVNESKVEKMKELDDDSKKQLWQGFAAKT